MQGRVAGVTERSPFLLQECPTGLVDEDTFKLIYSQFFPQGGAHECTSDVDFKPSFLWNGTLELPLVWFTSQGPKLSAVLMQ